MKRSVLVPLIACALLSPASRARAGELPSPLPPGDAVKAGLAPDRLEKMHARLRRVVDEGRSSGYVSLLARDGRIVDWRSYGQRDREAGAAMEKDTIVRIYSMSKLVTATAALVLLEDGALRLDDPVERFLPALKDRQVLSGGTRAKPVLVAAKGPITIRHLLSHTSGYVYDFGGEGPLQDAYRKAKLWEATSLDDFVARAATLPLHHQPGTEFQYGISSDVLGAVVEKAAGRPFEAFVAERVLVPLGMSDTGYDVPEARRTRLAKTYTRDKQGRLVEAEAFSSSYPEPGRGFASGGGGMFSTAGDYARFAQMLLNGGELDGVRILSRKTVELMTQNQLAYLARPHHAYDASRGFGLGPEVMIDLSQSGTLGSPGQFGWYGAATTYCQIDPKERLVALLLFQHVPMNETGVFTLFPNAYYSALVD
jgi:CubicO group peptidase (beta-lactamase class C family)